ncbi:MAG: nuclear transport factor 2 family protein [Sphingobium sp.]|nr:nuclear transport factor 2 family protein [Sphingobium sp.]MBP8671506.1 nuclear transport factor 2 family protein [Sphingobium sp.]MBP9158021.1 nuclear transport factor 2 family protein [Sphingobium sp.]MCC6482232.1 nuclear transport factor 2 family protein [Sphingomonadaceae bacterium]
MAESFPRFAKSVTLALVLAGGGIVFSSANAASKTAKRASLSEIETAAIKIACEDLSEQYAYYLDGKDYENLATLFTEDGVWEVLGNRMPGREAIRAYWKSRSEAWAPGYGRVHQMTNQVVKVVDRDHAIGQSVVMVHMFNNPSTEKQSLAPTVISRNDDEYVRTKDGWKFKRRSISTLAMEEPRH